MTRGPDEILKAILGPPQSAHPQAARSLCEALALWFQHPLSVVLCADDWESSSALRLCDGLGVGARTLHYEVNVVESLPRPRRGRRLAGLGDFRDLRQMDLRGLR
jgi:hypothetical protein